MNIWDYNTMRIAIIMAIIAANTLEYSHSGEYIGSIIGGPVLYFCIGYGLLSLVRHFRKPKEHPPMPVTDE